MSIFRRIADFLRGEQPPTLRNSVGGMAYVRRVPPDWGAEVLNNQIVKTIRLNECGTWSVEPRLNFVATADRVTSGGQLFLAGMRVEVAGIEDCLLEPLKGDGIHREEVDQLYAPGPVLIPLKVREMN